MAPTQADSVDEELMTQLEADLSGENQRPEVHVLSEGSAGSDTESIEANGPTGLVTRGTRRRLRLRWSAFATEHVSLHREARPRFGTPGGGGPTGTIAACPHGTCLCCGVQPPVLEWLVVRAERFAGTQPGNHIPARAQELLFSEACRFDARVALLEAFFVRLTFYGPNLARFLPMGGPAYRLLRGTDGRSWIQLV